MTKVFLTITTIVMISIATEGCYYDNEEELYPITDSTEITYTKNIQPIIANNCAIPGCHVPGGSGSGDFTSYSGVKAKVDNGTFHQRVIVEKTMPPAGPLGNNQLQILEKWINAGAPNN